MEWRGITLVAVAAAFLAVGCQAGDPLPSDPSRPLQPALDETDFSSPPTASEIHAAIDECSMGGVQNAFLKRFGNVVEKKNASQLDEAREMATDLVADFMEKSAEGHNQWLCDPTETALLSYNLLLFVDIELTAEEQDALEAAAEGGDSSVVVACNFGEDCFARTPDGCRAVSIPNQGGDEAYLVIINDIAENPFLRVPPGYNSWAIWMDLTITGLETGDPIDPPATAAVFVLEPPDPGAPTVPESQLALGHGTFVNEQPFVEILPPADMSILDETSCRASLTASLQGLQGLAARLIGPFSPSLALADPGELGGRLSAGSPLGAVDPLSDTETALDLSPPDDGEVTATATVTVVNDADQSLGTGAMVDFVLDPGGSETVLATVAPDANNQAVATFTCSEDVADGDQVQARFFGPNPGTDGTDTRAPSESNVETVDCGEDVILGSISGTVFDSEEEEYNGATVTLEMWDGDSWEFVATDTSGPEGFEDVAAGFYSFGNLAVGPDSLEDPNYRVSAADPDAGLASGFQEVLLTESDPDAEFVNLFLFPVIQ